MKCNILCSFALSSTLFLAGCTNTAFEESERARDELVGLGKTELLSCAGVPERTARLSEEVEFLSYTSEKVAQLPADTYPPGFYPSYGFGRYHRGYRSTFIFHGGTRSEIRRCTATFKLENDKVTSLTYHQNDQNGFAISQCYQIIHQCLPEKKKK
ncbi:MAG: hypothetical protein MI743_11915 [Sneathiellales bacterium]|nr:hypothetical protein [Sneathiellales bacterium]